METVLFILMNLQKLTLVVYKLVNVSCDNIIYALYIPSKHKTATLRNQRRKVDDVFTKTTLVRRGVPAG